jgi:hypothetical protein
MASFSGAYGDDYDSDLVVHKSGGGSVDSVARSIGTCIIQNPLYSVIFGSFIIVLIMVLIFIVAMDNFESMHNITHETGSPAGQRFFGERSEDRSVLRDPPEKVSGFLGNGNDAPYFSDVTNRVLRMENREKEAIRALGKINQERLRRAAEENSTSPLAWGPFWKEWKSTHAMDGEMDNHLSQISPY